MLGKKILKQKGDEHEDRNRKKFVMQKKAG
jgi:hypothetical protein